MIAFDGTADCVFHDRNKGLSSSKRELAFWIRFVNRPLGTTVNGLLGLGTEPSAVDLLSAVPLAMAKSRLI